MNISINEVVASAMIDLNMSDSPSARFFKWCDEAVRNLRCLSIYAPLEMVLDVDDMRAELPSGFVKLVAAQPYNSACNCPCDDYLYVDTPELDRCCILTDACGTPLSTVRRYYCDIFQIVGNHIHLHYPSDATHVYLWYMGLNKNENGLMVIDERYERAVTNYIKYMYACSPGSGMTKDDKYNYLETWKAQKDMLIGDDVVNQFDLTKRYIQLTTFNRIVITPR